MDFLSVRGRGDPNEEGSAYKQALELLCAVTYTIKMRKIGKQKLEGYFDADLPGLVSDLIANPRNLPQELVQQELEFRFKLFPDRKKEAK